MKTFVCTKFRLCKYLLDRNIMPYASEPDKNDPQYHVYLFEDTAKLRAAVAQYVNVDSWSARSKQYRKDKTSI